MYLREEKKNFKLKKSKKKQIPLKIHFMVKSNSLSSFFFHSFFFFTQFAFPIFQFFFYFYYQSFSTLIFNFIFFVYLFIFYLRSPLLFIGFLCFIFLNFLLTFTFFLPFFFLLLLKRKKNGTPTRVIFLWEIVICLKYNNNNKDYNNDCKIQRFEISYNFLIESRYSGISTINPQTSIFW